MQEVSNVDVILTSSVVDLSKSTDSLISTVGDECQDNKNKEIDVCKHIFEVGVINIGRSNDQLHVVGPVNERWFSAWVNPLKSCVYVDGFRVKESMNIKNGMMGVMVLNWCVLCQSDFPDLTVNPSLLWFGEPSPSISGKMGEIVGKEISRLVVLLDAPPAARVPQLVLFHGSGTTDHYGDVGDRVAVWAWSRKIGNYKEGKLHEGVTIVNLKNVETRRNISFNSESGYNSENEIILTRNESTTLDMRALRRLIFNELNKAMTKSDTVLDTANKRQWQKLIFNQLGKKMVENLECPARIAKNDLSSSFEKQLQKLVFNQLYACLQ